MINKIASRAARGNLPIDPRPYWRELSVDSSIGYSRTPGSVFGLAAATRR